MSLRGFYPWRVRSGYPSAINSDDFIEEFPFSTLVPQWRRPASQWQMHPSFTDFEHSALGDRPQIKNKQVVKRKVGSKEIGHASDGKNFTYNFDLNGFEPKDIKVKTVGQKVVVEAESEENEHKEGCHSFCHRHYHRTLMLPKNVKPEDIKSILTDKGVLSITAPMMAIEAPEHQEREIAVEAVEDAPMGEE